MALSETSFAGLLEDARRGDEGALNELLNSCRPQLRASVRSGLARCVQPRCDSSDVVQEGMVQVYQDLDRFRGRSLAEFNAWLRRIGFGTASRFGKYHTAAKRDVRAEAAGTEHVAGLAEVPGTDDLGRLVSAIRKLPAADQHVVVRHVFDGVPLDEVAKQLECSARHARRLFAGAVLRLTDLMVVKND